MKTSEFQRSVASREDLVRLALNGLAAYPPAGLGDLCSWCRDWCLAAADVRYCALADALQVVADWFDDRGGVLSSSMKELDVALQQNLPHIIDEDDASVAVAMTRVLHDELVEIVIRGEQGLNDLSS